MGGRWDLRPDIDVRVLDPKATRFLKLPDGQIVLVTEETAITIGKLLRAFPLSDPWRYIFVYDTEGREVGVLVDVGSLEEGSKAIVREELERRYRMPKILRVLEIERLPQMGRMRWVVETEAGRKEFIVVGRENIQTARYPRLFITDEEGNRYEIPDVEGLDAKSRRLVIRNL